MKTETLDRVLSHLQEELNDMAKPIDESAAMEALSRAVRHNCKVSDPSDPSRYEKIVDWVKDELTATGNVPGAEWPWFGLVTVRELRSQLAVEME